MPSIRALKTRAQGVPLAQWALGIAIAAVVISQVFVFPAGSLVSPWAFATGKLQPNLFLGVTPLTWASLVLALVCGIGALIRGLRDRRNLPVWSAIVGIAAISAFTASSFSSYLDGVGKLTLPLLVYIYIREYLPLKSGQPAAAWILWINLFVVAQVGVAWIFTGTPGPNTYYHELSREYFGYFYHPFAFSGILSICTLVAIVRLSRRQHAVLHAILIMANLALIVLSQVRTFLLALAAAIGVLAFGLLWRRVKRLWLFVATGLVALVAVWLPISGALGERANLDLSSGRFERWIQNIVVFFTEESPLTILFGGGPGHIYSVNERLFGVYINSLNLVVDLLVDHGVIGCILIAIAWVSIVRQVSGTTDRVYLCAQCTFMFTASMVTNTFSFAAVAVVFVLALFAVPRAAAIDEDAVNTSDTRSAT